MAITSFKVKLLTGTDPSKQYTDITTKDEGTFYLLSNGYGYLGTVPLFNGGKQKAKVIKSAALVDPEQDVLYVLDAATYNSNTYTGLYLYDGTALVNYGENIISAYITGLLVSDLTVADYTGDDETLPTTKAVVDAINAKLSSQSVLTAKFFRKVESHTLTADDITDTTISKPAEAAAGDIGLLFTADNDDTAGNENYYFINLKDYINIYTAGNTDSIKLAVDASNQFTATLNVSTTEKSITVDANGVSLNKTGTIDDANVSADKLVTEKSMTEYVSGQVLTAVNKAVADALKNVTTYTVDDGTTSST